tara:strand:- start:169 stop:504 length:336 start_codon:yes stop_codon:yes gene_type:complete
LELDGRMLFQIGAVIASLSGAWALVKSQVKTLKENQDSMKIKMTEHGRDLDKNDNSIAVMKNQLLILSGILSPNNLAKEHTRRGHIEAEVEMLMQDVSKLYDMHNGKHPPA